MSPCGAGEAPEFGIRIGFLVVSYARDDIQYALGHLAVVVAASIRLADSRILPAVGHFRAASVWENRYSQNFR